MSRPGVIVKNQREFSRALRRAGDDAAAQLKSELREAGQIVEEEAHTLIREQRLAGGERSTGRLDRLTRTSVRSSGAVFVRSGAMRGGFSYPAFQEFVRKRPFLYPALERKTSAVVARIERMLDRIAARFNAG